MTSHLSFSLVGFALSCGQRVTFEEPELSLSCGQRSILGKPELPLSCGQRSILGKPELPLSCGQRVTFFAGAKKVTKETPSRAEPAQEDPVGLRRRCAESHAQLSLRMLICTLLDSGIEAELGDSSALNEGRLFRLRRTSCLAHRSPVRKISARRICETELLGLRRTSCLANRLPVRKISAPRTCETELLSLRRTSCLANRSPVRKISARRICETEFLGLRRTSCLANRWRVRKISARRICETELLSLRRTSCPWDVSRACRISVRQTWACSDSTRCFFGDFLCTSKESYTLAAGQRKLWHSETHPFAERKRKPQEPRRYPLAAGQRKLERFGKIESGAPA